jgi:uncharacterized protein (TIGR03663 family)
MSSTLTRWERILYVVILVLALFTRFYMLEERAISHDESIHTKFSWNLYNGDGFQHNPMMHGPLLFHVTALNYHLFGADDFTSRIFTSLVGVALVMSPLLFRRWLGKSGALVVSALLLISPTITYYSRYIRHDVLLMMTAVLVLWTALQYLETGRPRWLIWLAASFSLMYTTKENSYIYTAIYGVLFFLPFVVQVVTSAWHNPRLYRPFVGLLIAAVLLASLFVLSLGSGSRVEAPLDDAGHTTMSEISIPLWGQISATLALSALGAAVVVVFYGVGEATMRRMRLFDVLMVLGTLTLPLGSAFLIRFGAGVDMLVVYNAVRTGNFSVVPGSTIFAIAAVTVGALAVSAAFGLWWNIRRWPIIALVHYTIFIVLYTTVFTWGFGALSGLIGGLAYWLAQHGVQRGNQPGYYYVFIGSLYEFLPILLSIGAGVAALFVGFSRYARLRDPESAASGQPQPLEWDWNRILPLFLLGWTLFCWIAYTIAGEKMPWLVVHIVLPSAFLGGWGLGRFLEALGWRRLFERRGWVMLLALPLVIAALATVVGGAVALRAASAGGASPAGPTLAQLQPQGQLVGGVLGLILFGGVLVWAVRHLGARGSLRLAALAGVLMLSLVTVRTMAYANYVNHDEAREFLVYAHGTADIKIALAQIEDVSWRTTGSARNVTVAYGEDGSWPFTWYMVNYPNNYFYGSSPDATRLLQTPVVIAGRPQFSVVESILGDEYVYFDYLYLWWPIQDYYDMTWERISNAVTDPELRAALWDILWHRDYDAYAYLKNPDAPFTLKTWPYRKEFRLYVQSEIAHDIWPQAGPSGAARFVRPVETPPPDPYAAGARDLTRSIELAMPGANVRGFAAAADGTFYVADSANHRLWHVGPEGVIDTFGSYGSGPGQFLEPWDVAIDAEGNIYVADTWNHRIQKFDANREYVTSWGGHIQVTRTGNPEAEGLFYGPRALALSLDGQELYVADTGNKRIQVFDSDGGFLREFGGGGTAAGRLEEPVGIDISATGLIAVADTWNRRVQVFDSEGVPLRQSTMPTWDTMNPDLKPFLAWGDEGLYVGDALQRRVLAFDMEGGYRWALSAGAGATFSFPQGLLVLDGVLYVSDAHTGNLVGYVLP